MPTVQNIRWFKQQFQDKIEAAVQGTGFTVDMVTAIACQETGYIWGELRKHALSIEEILELCVGDTIDGNGAKGRSAFPINKAQLLTKPQGQQMFDLARDALLRMSHYIRDYRAAASNPAKFCRGFGIFQYDLQFFLTEPEYFLEKRYTNFNNCLSKCIKELNTKKKRIGLADKNALTDLELAAVAIAYNRGNYNPQKGLQQGYKSSGKYYGENFYDYLQLSKTVSAGASDVVTPVPLPSWTSDATGPYYEVEVTSNPLRLRSQPIIDNTTHGVIAKLTDGQIVKAIDNVPVNGFLEVETNLPGGLTRGFAYLQYLKRKGDN